MEQSPAPILKQKQPCPYHPTKNAKLICMTCEGAQFCSLCITSHIGHQVDLAPQFSEFALQMSKELSEVQSRKEAQLEEIKKQYIRVNDDLDSVSRDINFRFNQIQRTINEEARNLRGIIQNTKLNNSKEQNKLEEELQQINELIKSVYEEKTPEQQEEFASEVSKFTSNAPRLTSYRLVGEKIPGMIIGFLTNAETSSEQVKKAQWTYEDNSEWKKYEQADNIKLETALLKDMEQVQIWNGKYEVNLKQMWQKNMKTGWFRRVRRIIN